METAKIVPHKHPFLSVDKWSRIEKEVNDSGKEYLDNKIIEYLK
jgi:hypothetical protein